TSPPRSSAPPTTRSNARSASCSAPCAEGVSVARAHVRGGGADTMEGWTWRTCRVRELHGCFPAPPAAAGRRADRVPRARRVERLAPAERHGAVAAPGDLPDPEGGAAAGLRAGRAHHAGQPDDGVAAAAPRRLLHRPAAAPPVAGGGHAVHAVGADPA